MKRFVLTLLVAGVMTVPNLLAQERCQVGDLEDYYGEALDEEYKIHLKALEIAEGLFRGPMMKEGRSADVASFRDRFNADRDIELRDLQRLVRKHLFDDSTEFQELFARLEKNEGAAKATAKIRDSIYSAYGFKPKRVSDEKLDACLVASGHAELVVTRAIVDFMERENLD